MSTDPNLSREELEKLIAELEREQRKRFWNDPRPIHWAIQEPGATPPVCPPGHKMIVRVIVAPPQREEKEQPRTRDASGSCAATAGEVR
jgi:hypothetical protein